MKRAVWSSPVALAVSSAVGLIAGLLGDGAWDWVSWAGLSAPVAVCAWGLLKQGRRQRGRRH